MRILTASWIALSVLFSCSSATGNECAPASIFVSGRIVIPAGECNEQPIPVPAARILFFLDDREVDSHVEGPNDSCTSDQEGKLSCELWFDSLNGFEDKYDPTTKETWRIPKCDGKVQKIEAVIYKMDMISKRIIIGTFGKKKIDLGKITIWKQWHNDKGLLPSAQGK